MRSFLIPVVLLSLATPTSAQVLTPELNDAVDRLLSGASENTAAEKIVGSLIPGSSAPVVSGPGATRSIRVQPSGSGANAGPTRAIVVVERGREDEVWKAKESLPKVSLSIQFEFNSDRLTLEGRQSIVPLAAALKDPRLKSEQFLVGGHTDGIGGLAFNQNLSERRAQAVRDHLVSEHQVGADRLKVLGFGKRQLVDTKDPAAAANRRVEIVTLPR